MHYTRIFRNQRVANSSASKLQPAMVDISYRCQITYQEEKPVSIAADLVEEHQGQKFLKISATNYAICQLVCGGKLPTKNPSLARSKELQALVQARNDKIQEYFAAPEETQDLFDSEMPKNKCTKKRLAQAMEEPGDKFMVTILLGSTEIPCLVGGQRLAKCDLCCPTQQKLQGHFERIKPQVTIAVVATKREVAAKDCKSHCLA